jgi:diguanylate cyclase (GGDEF)-like protein
MALPTPLPAAAVLAPRLRAVYQPIVRLDDFGVLGHEGLVRYQSADGALHPPLELLARAREAGRLPEIEALCARTVAEHSTGATGLLFVNLSALAILQSGDRAEAVLEALRAGVRDLRRVVVEITERDVVHDVGLLADTVAHLRAAGVRIALDDFGDGGSNFRIWHEMAPDFVKLDRCLVHGLAGSATRAAILKALVPVAEALGSELIGEGLESLDDLALMRDLGVRIGQGFVLGRPQAAPAAEAAVGLDAIARGVPVRPFTHRSVHARHVTARHLAVDAPVLSPDTSNNAVAEQFARTPALHALPVVVDGRPIGLVNRLVFMERYAQPYTRDLFGTKSCTTFMHADPVCCEADEPVEALVGILRGEDQRYLTDGFVVTQQGRYLGLGTGESLVRRVTELRIEAARYANPLTLLPGNIPITEHIVRLLEAGRPFIAAYADLNHFKPFNDQYGYFRGDQMIRLLAETLMAHAEPRSDFVGHVGGDDFVVLFQSPDWRERCERIVADFNQAAASLFDAQDLARGGHEAEDRQGHAAFFPLTTLTIGACAAGGRGAESPEDIATRAAAAKRRAKHDGVRVWFAGVEGAAA